MTVERPTHAAAAQELAEPAARDSAPRGMGETEQPLVTAAAPMEALRHASPIEDAAAEMAGDEQLVPHLQARIDQLERELAAFSAPDPRDGVGDKARSGSNTLVFWLGAPLVLAVALGLSLVATFLWNAGQDQKVGATSSGRAAAAATSSTSIAPTVTAPSVASLAEAAASPAPSMTPSRAAAAAVPTPGATAPARAVTTVIATAAPSRQAVRVVKPSTTPVFAPLQLAWSMSVGSALCDLAADDSGSHLYVADDGAEQVLVVDPAERRIVRTIDIHDSLCSIAVDQRSHTLFVPSWRRSSHGGYDRSAILTVDLASGSIRSYNDDHFPSGPYIDPRSNRLFVGNTAARTVTTIDAASGTGAELSVNARVNRIAVSPTSGRLYLASPEDNKVVVADPKQGGALASLAAGQRPWGVVADPATGNVLVSSEVSGTVELIDAQKDQVMRTAKVGGHPRNLAVDAAHGRFYVLNVGDRTISTINTDATQVQTSAPLPGAEEPTGLAVTAGDGHVFVVSKTHIYMFR